VESLVSLSWCIRQGTRGEGDGYADYLPPQCSINMHLHTLLFNGVIMHDLQ